jgi:hypothetical protein
VALIDAGLVGLSGLAMLFTGLIGSISFFGDGADEEFRRWIDRPLMLAGGAAVALALCGLLGGLTLSGTSATAATSCALLLGLVVLAGGLVEHSGRAHPQ